MFCRSSTQDGRLQVSEHDIHWPMGTFNFRIVLTYCRRRTSFPVLTHPLTSSMTPRPIILNKIKRVRGSRTCSFVARSLLSFILACALGPFLFTPTPITYGASIFARRELYFARAASWSEVLSLPTISFVAAVLIFALFGTFTAGRAATLACVCAEDVPWALPVRTAACCRNRLYCFVKSTNESWAGCICKAT